MPRILYVVNIPRFFYTHRLPLALAAREAGYDVHIATSDADAEHVALIRQTGLPFHALPLAQHGTNPLSELRTFMALRRLYRELKPDLVHQVSIKPVLYGGLAARFAGNPAVVSAMSGLGYVFIGQTGRARLLRQIIRPLFGLALQAPRTHMIFQNPEDQARFVRMGLIRADKTHLIRGSGVHMEQFSPQPEAPGLPVVLFAGRLMWQKGLGDFVAAAQRLQGRARFVVAGYAEASSPDTVAPQQLQSWADAGWIEWVGKQSDMPAQFAASHIVCLPSSYGEGVPKVLIEAAACGRPIVTTDTPGCREICRHEDNGLLVPVGDVDALSEALGRLIDSPSLRQHYGARGRAIAEADFAFERVRQDSFALYEMLLSGASDDGDG